MAFPANRELHARRRIILFAVGLAAYVLAALLALVPGFTDAVYGSAIGPLLSRLLSLLTGWIPIALGEIVIAAFLIRQIAGSTVAIRDVIRKQRSPANALAAGVLRVAQDTGILVALFYLLWGFNYSRPTLDEKLDWTLPERVTIEELDSLILQTVFAANEAYREIHRVEDAGEPTRLGDDSKAVEDRIVEGWVAARTKLGLSSHTGFYGRAKTPALTPLLERLGVAGYYFPYTAEANLRGGIPALDQPKMLAHEKAHQRGVAREAEANFWGYLACTHSTDPHARYSAFVFAQRQLMLGMMRAHPDRLLELVRLRLPGVQRDIDDSRRYWASFRGRGTRVGTAVNNAFLRTNRVEGGVENYSMSALFFVAYARERGGRVVPDSETPILREP
jgi:hypothetical protein